MFTVILFLVLGMIFGAAASKGAWFLLIVPVVFGALDLFFEGIDVYSLILIAVTIAATIVGILIGHALLSPRLRRREA